jgi:hypothetical protein
LKWCNKPTKAVWINMPSPRASIYIVWIWQNKHQH